MNSLVLAALLCIFLVGATADVWKSCGSGSDHVKINSVTITPDPPKKGQSLSITANVTLDEQLTAGTLHVELKYSIITVLNKTLDLCDTIQPYQACPIAAGNYQRTVSEDLPSDIPAGHYTGQVKVLDQASAELACIALDLEF
eukprot:CAMPEP_0177633866 /NCGR_PEP_ID=MMETSP0447-20121125/3066_1 /TAXON_ID=0 /ORGANISM="Stygamoeba regulata, Strain BSH-02190019" /LENGTH=142 /DNA_ID=CAMNT_0019135555 /DNA_START=183 /DNA_END=611 /DNA_ORIENTATION=-